jgi:hypothetical protein
MGEVEHEERKIEDVSIALVNSCDGVQIFTVKVVDEEPSW